MNKNVLFSLFNCSLLQCILRRHIDVDDIFLKYIILHHHKHPLLLAIGFSQEGLEWIVYSFPSPCTDVILGSQILRWVVTLYIPNPSPKDSLLFNSPNTDPVVSIPNL